MVQDHLHGTVPMPAKLLAHTNFLFSPPHPSLPALQWQCWHGAIQCTGTLEVRPSELDGQHAALLLRTMFPTAMGWLEYPQPKERFYFQPGLTPAPAHSEQK